MVTVIFFLLSFCIFFLGLHPFSQDVAVTFDKLEFDVLNDENDDFSDQVASDYDQNAATCDFKIKPKTLAVNEDKKIEGEICKTLGKHLIRLLEILGANDSTGLHHLWSRDHMFYPQKLDKGRYNIVSVHTQKS